MDWITERVAIGSRVEAHDAAVLRGSGIRSVLSLDGTLASADAGALGLDEIVSVPLRDGSGNELSVFRLAVESLTRLAADHAPVLVHCELGRSRSPAVVAGYVMGLEGLDPLQARALVASKCTTSISAALVPFLFQL